jgi:hypothetical protein
MRAARPIEPVIQLGEARSAETYCGTASFGRRPAGVRVRGRPGARRIDSNALSS